MAKVVIYTTTVCPFCVRAKMLLTKKKAAYEEINLTHDLARREEMMQRSGGKRSVPQIFINDHYVGGCDDLYELDFDGELDAMLEA